MSSEWTRKRLAEISEVITGFPFKGEKYLPPKHGVRVVRGDNVTERYVRWGEKEKCWSVITADLKPYVLRSGDVVIGMDGSKVGKNFAAISPDDEGSLLAQRVARLRAREGISQDYLRYVICNDSFTEYVKAVHTGTSIPHISKGQIENFEVVVPPFEDQQQIAAILISLDDRITLLRETNATLEAIAQALFKSWFVDFDPVRAKMEGRTPEGIDEATAALFPDGFETSELGEVPRGWRVCAVEDFAERVGMGPFGSNIKVETFVESGIPVISGQHLKQLLVEDNTFNFITHEHAARLAKSCVHAGDVIFTHAGSIGQVSLLHKDAAFTSYVLSQRQFFLRCNTELMNPEWIALYFKLPAGQHQLLANTSQVGVPSIARPVSYLRSIRLVVPPPALNQRFAFIAGAINDRVMANRKQFGALSQIRDTLLPRLISGQLRLSEAQAATEVALGGALSV